MKAAAGIDITPAGSADRCDPPELRLCKVLPAAGRTVVYKPRLIAAKPRALSTVAYKADSCQTACFEHCGVQAAADRHGAMSRRWPFLRLKHEKRATLLLTGY